MTNNRDLILRQLAKLKKAYAQLSRATRGRHRAEANADRRLQELLDMLDAHWASSIDELIGGARKRMSEEGQQFDEAFASQSDTLLMAEGSLIQEAGAKASDIHRLYLAYNKTKSDRDQFVATTQELRERLIALHKAVKKKLLQTASLPRTPKRATKRKIAQGVASFVFGTGMIIANTTLPHLGPFSYAIAAGALHQALRDFIGHAAD